MLSVGGRLCSAHGVVEAIEGCGQNTMGAMPSSVRGLLGLDEEAERRRIPPTAWGQVPPSLLGLPNWVPEHVKQPVDGCRCKPALAMQHNDRAMTCHHSCAGQRPGTLPKSPDSVIAR